MMIRGALGGGRVAAMATVGTATAISSPPVGATLPMLPAAVPVERMQRVPLPQALPLPLGAGTSARAFGSSSTPASPQRRRYGSIDSNSAPALAAEADAADATNVGDDADSAAATVSAGGTPLYRFDPGSPEFVRAVSASEGTLSQTTNPDQDLEIKDAGVIFRALWQELIDVYGVEHLVFPHEINFLGGAPGSGKGTQTDFIRHARDIHSEPIVLSALLTSPAAQAFKDKGGLVPDKVVIRLILEELLKPEYAGACLVDGFPRTLVQAECVKLLYRKLQDLRVMYGEPFQRPLFHITVLFVEERTSVERQLSRGRAVAEHNKAVARGDIVGEPLPARATDLSEDYARKRYKIFRDNYQTLLRLQEDFTFSLIDASPPIERVQEAILKEFQYQSAFELSEDLYNHITTIPLASDIIKDARTHLVQRLEGYPWPLLQEVVAAIEEDFIEQLRAQSISGTCTIVTKNKLFMAQQAVNCAIDVLSERGFRVSYRHIVHFQPVSVDRNSFQIKTREVYEHAFTVTFERFRIRDKV